MKKLLTLMLGLVSSVLIASACFANEATDSISEKQDNDQPKLINFDPIFSFPSVGWARRTGGYKDYCWWPICIMNRTSDNLYGITMSTIMCHDGWVYLVSEQDINGKKYNNEASFYLSRGEVWYGYLMWNVNTEKRNQSVEMLKVTYHQKDKIENEHKSSNIKIELRTGGSPSAGNQFINLGVGYTEDWQCSTYSYQTCRVNLDIFDGRPCIYLNEM